jgi:hypothetical protein
MPRKTVVVRDQVVVTPRLSAMPEGQSGSSNRLVSSCVDSVILTHVVSPESNELPAGGATHAVSRATSPGTAASSRRRPRISIAVAAAAAAASAAPTHRASWNPST